MTKNSAAKDDGKDSTTRSDDPKGTTDSDAKSPAKENKDKEIPHDESFDEDDEIPLSQLITQVKAGKMSLGNHKSTGDKTGKSDEPDKEATTTGDEEKTEQETKEKEEEPKKEPGNADVEDQTDKEKDAEDETDKGKNTEDQTDKEKDSKDQTGTGKDAKDQMDKEKDAEEQTDKEKDAEDQMDKEKDAEDQTGKGKEDPTIENKDKPDVQETQVTAESTTVVDESQTTTADLNKSNQPENESEKPQDEASIPAGNKDAGNVAEANSKQDTPEEAEAPAIDPTSDPVECTSKDKEKSQDNTQEEEKSPATGNELKEAVPAVEANPPAVETAGPAAGVSGEQSSLDSPRRKQQQLLLTENSSRRERKGIDQPTSPAVEKAKDGDSRPVATTEPPKDAMDIDPTIVKDTENTKKGKGPAATEFKPDEATTHPADAVMTEAKLPSTDSAKEASVKLADQAASKETDNADNTKKVNPTDDDVGAGVGASAASKEAEATGSTTATTPSKEAPQEGKTATAPVPVTTDSNFAVKDESKPTPMDVDDSTKQAPTKAEPSPMDAEDTKGVSAQKEPTVKREANDTSAVYQSSKDTTESAIKEGTTEDSPIVLNDNVKEGDTSTVNEQNIGSEAQAPTILKVDPPSKAPQVPTWIVESESEEEEGKDSFASFKSTNRTLGRMSKKRKRGRRLKITTLINKDGKKAELKKEAEPTTFPPIQLTKTSIFHESVEEQLAAMEQEVQDSLNFFREPHEDQDPSYAELEKSKKQKDFENDLKKLEEETEAGKKDIEDIIAERVKEKQVSTDRSVEKYKAKTIAEEKKDMERLQQMYNEKNASNQQKINQGIQVLRKRHSQESQKVHQQHRQQAQQRRLSEQMAVAEWNQLSQRLRAKHQRQLQEFAAKGEDVKKRCEGEYKNDHAKLRNQYEKRLRDVETNRQTLYQRISAGFQQIRQRYLKRHLQKMAKKKEEILTAMEELKGESGEKNDKTTATETSKTSAEEKVELRPPSPVKTHPAWFEESHLDKSGAAARHKHRKGVLSQINKQMSVEIHNEGIWVAQLLDKKDDSKNKKKDSTEQNSSDDSESDHKFFVPWGVKARDFLESIICGEIPYGFGSEKFDFSETSMVNGGHVRCVMTDLRTSDTTASALRASAIQEYEEAEIESLEKKFTESTTALAEAEKQLQNAEKQEKDISVKAQAITKDLENKKQSMQNFRTKFGRFLGPDGAPLPTTNPSDRQKLIQATMKYKSGVEAAEKRDAMAKAKVAEVKALVQKHQGLVKAAQRTSAIASAAVKKRKTIQIDSAKGKLKESEEGEKASVRVKNTIAAFGLAAAKRREQLNQKRSNSTSTSWIQTLPGIPSPLRKSLWYKMHRRRQQIVLRPSLEALVSELRDTVEKKLSSTEIAKRAAKADSTTASSNSALDEEFIKAEQAFLLATHPVAPKGEHMSSIPSSSSWAEPGWHLVLDVPKVGGKHILPRAQAPRLVQSNLSELHSAPGRQAAALVKTTHLRSLASPLSAVTTATSLAETNPAVAFSTHTVMSESDPLRQTEQLLSIGYAFTLKPQITKPAPAQRKKSSTSTEKPAVVPPAKPTKKPTPSAESTSASKAPAPAPKPERKRKSTTTASRNAQRRKPEPKAPAPAPQPMPRNVVQQQPPPPQQQQHPPQQQANDHNMMANRSSFARQQPMQGMNQQPNSYNQFQPMQSPPTQPQAQRGSFNQQMFQQQQQRQPVQQQQQQQFQNPQQMAQLRMMQQQQHQQHQHQQQHHPQQHQHQQQQPPPGQQVGYPQHGMQQMQGFFPPMPQQQLAPQPMQMPGQVVGQPGGMPMNLQGNPVRPTPPPGDDQNDPLFMLGS